MAWERHFSVQHVAYAPRNDYVRSVRDMTLVKTIFSRIGGKR